MGRLFIGVMVFALGLPCLAQQQDQSAPPPQQNPPAANHPAAKNSGSPTPQKKKPSEAEQNPFPEAQSEAAAHQADQQDSNSVPAAPAPQAPSAKPSTADRNPFPEAQSQKAAQQDETSAPPPSGANPGAPGKDFSSSQSGVKDLDLPDTDASSADAGGTALDPKLGRQDTQVGLFYLRTGDYKGAYGRFAEAARVDPGNAEAVFGLAEAARHLNQRGTAISNYQLYLTALPDGPHAKEARKALKDLGASSGS